MKIWYEKEQRHTGATFHTYLGAGVALIRPTEPISCSGWAYAVMDPEAMEIKIDEPTLAIKDKEAFAAAGYEIYKSLSQKYK